MGFCMTGLQCFSVKPGFRWYRSSNAYTTSRPKLPHSWRLGLDWGRIWDFDDGWTRGWKSFYQNQHSASPSTAAFDKKDTFHHSHTVSCFLETFWHDYCVKASITVKNPLWMSSSVSTVSSSREHNCVKVKRCQRRRTVVWVDCAKIACCIGFFFFLSIYMLL